MQPNMNKYLLDKPSAPNANVSTNAEFSSCPLSLLHSTPPFVVEQSETFPLQLFRCEPSNRKVHFTDCSSLLSILKNNRETSLLIILPDKFNLKLVISIEFHEETHCPEIMACISSRGLITPNYTRLGVSHYRIVSAV